MRRILVIPLALLVLLLGAMIWSGGGVEKRADFRFINRGDIGTLDPNRMSWMQDIRVGYALWEGLYTLEEGTMKAVPGTAESIEISDDKMVYTFHIRPEARWSNGDAVVAGDFVFAWRRMLEEPGDYTYLLYYINGAEEYAKAFAEKKSARFEDVGIEDVDDTILRVTLKHPLAFFPDLCAFPPFFPLNEKSMAAFRRQDPKTGRVTFDKKFTTPPNLVGNGPYRLSSWEFKRRLRLEASEYYWDREHVRSKSIEMVNAEDPMWAFLRYDEGNVDWIADASGEIGAELHARKRADLHVFPSFGTYFYSFNCLPRLPDGSANPFSDVRVRQAFSMAIDRTPIVEKITRLGERPAFTYIPLGAFAEYSSPPGLGYDVEMARKLLAEAGYPGGQGFPRRTLLFNNEFVHPDIAQYVHEQWLRNLGVDMVLEGVEIKVFREKLHSKNYAIARASWFGDYNDPSTFTDKYLTGGENNDSGWSNAEYDRLAKEAVKETDESRRWDLFKQAETILLQEQPILPVYYYVNSYLFRDNVKGLTLEPRAMTMLKWAAKK